jgi:hypothetical protein
MMGRNEPSMMQQGPGRHTISTSISTPFPIRYGAFAVCVVGLVASGGAVLALPHLRLVWLRPSPGAAQAAQELALAA